MQLYVYVYIYIYMHAYVYIYRYMCVYAYVYTPVRAYKINTKNISMNSVHMYICICMYVSMYVMYVCVYYI